MANRKTSPPSRRKGRAPQKAVKKKPAPRKKKSPPPADAAALVVGIIDKQFDKYKTVEDRAFYINEIKTYVDTCKSQCDAEITKKATAADHTDIPITDRADIVPVGEGVDFVTLPGGGCPVQSDPEPDHCPNLSVGGVVVPNEGEPDRDAQEREYLGDYEQKSGIYSEPAPVVQHDIPESDPDTPSL